MKACPFAHTATETHLRSWQLTLAERCTIVCSAIAARRLLVLLNVTASRNPTKLSRPECNQFSAPSYGAANANEAVKAESLAIMSSLTVMNSQNITMGLSRRRFFELLAAAAQSAVSATAGRSIIRRGRCASLSGFLQADPPTFSRV